MHAPHNFPAQQELSKRQRECLGLVAEGLSTKEIARALKLSPSTIDNHLQIAVTRLGASGRQDAVVRYSEYQSQALSNNVISELYADMQRENSNHDNALKKWENMIYSRKWLAALFSIPPLGGEETHENKTLRFYRIIQIASLSLITSLAVIITISSVILLLNIVYDGQILKVQN